MAEQRTSITAENDGSETAKQIRLSIAQGPPINEAPFALWTLLARAAKEYPEYMAVTSMYQGCHQKSLRWSFQELMLRAQNLAKAWFQRGLRKGDRVVVLLPNSSEFALVLWATALIGACLVPLEPQSIGRIELVNHFLAVANPAALVVLDENSAIQLEKHHNSQIHKLTFKLCLTGEVQGWQTLATISIFDEPTIETLPEPEVDIENDIAIIIFTSGTTNLPKACPHTGASISAMSYNQRLWRRLYPGRSLLQHLPCTHIFSLFYSIAWWAAGGGIVIPSPQFDPVSSIVVLEQGLCTDVPVVPSMFNIIISHPRYNCKSIKGVITIGLAGSMLPTSFVQKARDAFQAKSIFTGYGLSEMLGISSWHLDEYENDKADFVRVGKAGYGAHLKICKPGTRDVVPFDHEGEVHASSPCAIKQYLAGGSQDFYDDAEGLRWFQTGDQAKMDQDGVLTILGRYKDVIIRGGENISPALLEAKLNDFEGIEAQVVGMADPVAGEVPVAVIRRNSATVAIPYSAMQDRIRSDIGTTALIARYFTFEELCMQTWPTTVTGKVQKQVLRETIKDFIASELDSGLDDASDSSTLSLLTKVWSRMLAISQSEVPLDTSISQLADSLTMARVRVLVRQKLGKDLPNSQLNTNDTIREQAEIWDSTARSSLPMPDYDHLKHFGPPALADMVHLRGSHERYAQTRDTVSHAIAKFNLTWDSDVEDIYPMTHCSSRLQNRVRDYHFNLHNIMIICNSSKDNIIRAFATALESWGSFRTVVVEVAKGEPLHVQIRLQNWLKCVVATHGDCVHDEEELKNLAQNKLGEYLVHTPGPLFRAVIVEFTNPSKIGLITLAHHNICDAVSLQAFREDLTNVLKNEAYQITRIPYKLFADMFYNGRESANAEEAATFHVKSMDGMRHHQSSMWPSARSPGWFLGNDQGSGLDRKHLDGGTGEIGLNGVEATVRTPFLKDLQSKHRIHAPTLVKSAIAILQVHQTNHDTALFTTIVAGRQWPFVADWVSERLPDPLDIAGPTFISVGEKLTIDKLQTTLELLQRVLEHQQLANRHTFGSHSAGFYAALDPEDTKTWRDFMPRNCFNWIPTWRNEDDEEVEGSPSITLLRTNMYHGVGLIWNCHLQNSPDPSIHIHAIFDDAQLSLAEMRGHVERLSKIIGWLHQPENLEAELGRLFTHLDSDGSNDP